MAFQVDKYASYIANIKIITFFNERIKKNVHIQSQRKNPLKPSKIKLNFS